MIRRLEDAAKTLQFLFDLSCLVNFEERNAQLSEISSRLRDLLRLTEKIRERFLYLYTDEETTSVSYVSQTMNHTGNPGRPCVEVSREQVDFFRSLQFTRKE